MDGSLHIGVAAGVVERVQREAQRDGPGRAFLAAGTAHPAFFGIADFRLFLVLVVVDDVQRAGAVASSAACAGLRVDHGGHGWPPEKGSVAGAFGPDGGIPACCGECAKP